MVLSERQDRNFTCRVREGARRRHERTAGQAAVKPGTLGRSPVHAGYWLQGTLDHIAARFVLQLREAQPAFCGIQRRDSRRYGLWRSAFGGVPDARNYEAL